jgi:2-polyprenyl-3-methyl-5-hydroxy-6-metoxy-1,4-benzoquinol methylase
MISINRSRYQEKLDPWSSHSLIIGKLAAFPPGTKILDVGTAGGILGKLLADKGYLIYGIEPNQNWASEAWPYYEEVMRTTLESVSDELLRESYVIIFAMFWSTWCSPN